MYLTVCPLRGSGHESSVGERMYRTVSPLHGPGRDSSVGKWMYLSFPRGPGSIPDHGRVFRGVIYSLVDHMGCLAHSSWSTKERSGAPLEKCLQSHEDNERPTDQPGLWRTKKYVQKVLK